MGELCVIIYYLLDLDECDIYWKIVVQIYEEKEKVMSLICKFWVDIYGGVLFVMKVKGQELKCYKIKCSLMVLNRNGRGSCF